MEPFFQSFDAALWFIGAGLMFLGFLMWRTSRSPQIHSGLLRKVRKKTIVNKWMLVGLAGSILIITLAGKAFVKGGFI